MRWGLNTATRHLATYFHIGNPHTANLEYQGTITENNEQLRHRDRKRLKSGDLRNPESFSGDPWTATVVYVCLSPPGNPFLFVSAIINCASRISYIECAGCIDRLLQYVAGGFALVEICRISGRGQRSVTRFAYAWITVPRGTLNPKNQPRSRRAYFVERKGCRYHLWIWRVIRPLWRYFLIRYLQKVVFAVKREGPCDFKQHSVLFVEFLPAFIPRNLRIMLPGNTSTRRTISRTKDP